MNCFSNLNHYFLYYLQQYNTKTKVTKTITLNNDENDKNDKNDENDENVIKSDEL